MVCMKKLFLLIPFFLLLGCEQNTLVKSGNLEQKPIPFDFKTTRDADCGMIVSGLKFAAQVISEDGKTWFFHDQGGVAKFLKEKSLQEGVVVWFFTMDTKRWMRSGDVWFTQVEETPMGYGFVAHEKKKEGFITYDEMSLKMLRGENLNNPFIRKKLLG